MPLQDERVPNDFGRRLFTHETNVFLAATSDEQRQYLVLRALATGVSQEVAASGFGVPIETIRGWIRQAQ
ncbi:hypothetical protein [Humidisolicoccus flavus]|uniref:hypothetical protein n=1 Tax=Humidisolicoccus flavus TaxID=3111414 RepID=UPI0032561532